MKVYPIENERLLDYTYTLSVTVEGSEISLDTVTV